MSSSAQVFLRDLESTSGSELWKEGETWHQTFWEQPARCFLFARVDGEKTARMSVVKIYGRARSLLEESSRTICAGEYFSFFSPLQGEGSIMFCAWALPRFDKTFRKTFYGTSKKKIKKISHKFRSSTIAAVDTASAASFRDVNNCNRLSLSFVPNNEHREPLCSGASKGVLKVFRSEKKNFTD